MWYGTRYRRNLVDMHIDDWSPEFLRAFDPEAYYQNLVRGRIQAPMIYLQSHVGHCYFPTRVGHTHGALAGREDVIRQLIDSCRTGGMKVVGYYSLIYNTYEEDRHPEWKIHDGSGRSPRDKGGRYGLLCPNNGGYRAFVSAQIQEMADYFTVDGMFYDMLFWPEVCRCDACKERFAREVGGDIPQEVDWQSARWLAFTRKRREWLGDFAAFVTRETRRLMPGVTVEYNYACALSTGWRNGLTEVVNEQSDYTGGDLYGSLYNHSFTCKYYMNITKNPPFEYMTCRCADALNQHTVTKTEEALELEIMLTAAHHGASFIIDAIDPRGTMDARVYERIGRIFARHERYEPYFKGEHIADVGVFYSTASRYNREGQAFTNMECAIETAKTMMEHHIPVDVLSYGCPEKIEGKRMIFVPYLYELAPEIEARLVRYVEDGGVIYFSGPGCEGLLGSLLDAHYTGEMTREDFTYLAPAMEEPGLFGEFTRAFPMPFTWKLPLVDAPREGVAATITLPYTARSQQRFASIHSDPPGIETAYPGLIIRPYGKGHVIWSAAPIELDGRIQYKRVIMALLERFVPRDTLSVRAQTSKGVEVIAFRTEAGFILSAVDLLCDEELVPIRAFPVTIRSDRPCSAVVRLPERTPVAFENRPQEICFEAEAFTMHAFYEILTENK